MIHDDLLESQTDDDRENMLFMISYKKPTTFVTCFEDFDFAVDLFNIKKRRQFSFVITFLNAFFVIYNGKMLT